MRTPQRRLTRQQVSRTLSVSAPVAGWNARDSLAEMGPTDAVGIDNFFCTPYDVMVRFGFSLWATGIPGTVNTVASYSPPVGGIKLFAAAGSNVYDATNPGAVGAPVITGATSDKWQHVNFGTAGGNFMYLVNGSDAPQLFNGTTWQAVTAVSAPVSITGVTASNLINVTAFKARLWFIERNSMKAWYLPTLSVGGTAASLDLSSLFTKGGYLMSMGNWSLDAGYGMDDYAVFVTSEGQVAVYKGTDPASATTWALIGIYDIGSPIGRRCLMKYAGDLTLICKDGLAPLSKSLMSSRVNSMEMLTDKIQHVVSDYTTLYAANFGWETALFPQENMLLVNVPTSPTTSYQLVMNTISGAWSRFIGWNASCFELHGDELFFGSSGGVCKAWDTQADNGTNIDFEAQQSFNYFGARSQLKQVKMLRPLISTDGSSSVLLGVNTDFDTTAPTGIPTFSPTAGAAWDISVWDGMDTWSGDLAIKKDWQTAFGLGYCISAHIKGAAKNSKLRWAATDYLVDDGGVI
ncbi:Uncharacterized conserved protein [Janthinobacterium sp. Marseille]|nr:hypothetical protein [Janthinobacterium sp. Marseille]ABR91434.1 Uncharacterized conserved protein [Janthinobacterium sp. Marseille]